MEIVHILGIQLTMNYQQLEKLQIRSLVGQADNKIRKGLEQAALTVKQKLESGSA
jgi:hypothetical protein